MLADVLANLIGASLGSAFGNHLANLVGAGLGLAFGDHLAALVFDLLGAGLTHVLDAIDRLFLTCGDPDFLAADAIRSLAADRLAFAGAVNASACTGIISPLTRHLDGSRVSATGNHRLASFPVSALDGDRLCIGNCLANVRRDVASLGFPYWTHDRVVDGTSLGFPDRLHHRIVNRLFSCFPDRSTNRVGDFLGASFPDRLHHCVVDLALASFPHRSVDRVVDGTSLGFPDRLHHRVLDLTLTSFPHRSINRVVDGASLGFPDRLHHRVVDLTLTCFPHRLTDRVIHGAYAIFAHIAGAVDRLVFIDSVIDGAVGGVLFGYADDLFASHHHCGAAIIRTRVVVGRSVRRTIAIAIVGSATISGTCQVRRTNS